MGNRSSLVSSRVARAIIGAVVVGGIIAVVGIAGPAVYSSVALAGTGRSQTTGSSSTSATPGAAASHDQSATPGVTPTTAAAPTTTPRPKPPASPTATPLPSLEGAIVSTSPATDSFMLAPDRGSPVTVHVNSNTNFRGAASSLSTLGSGGNWQADVRGVYLSAGNFLAYWVDSCNSVLC